MEHALTKYQCGKHEENLIDKIALDHEQNHHL